MYFTTSLGHRLWVRVAPGPGDAVLLLHGFPDTSQLWEQQVQALSLAGYHVLAPDMLGYGKSDKPQQPEPYGLATIVSGLVELLDHQQLQQVHVVGHDWGAATAWRLAISHPQRCRSLTVLSVGHPGAGTAAGGPRQRAKWWYMLFFQYKDVAERCLAANNWALFREFMAGSAAAPVVEQYIQQLQQPGALTAALNWYRANFHPGVFGQTQPRSMPKLHLPVLGVWSDGDTALTEEQMTASQQYVAEGMWQYARLEGASHWIPRDAGQRVATLMVSFWNSEVVATAGKPGSSKRSKL